MATVYGGPSPVLPPAGLELPANLTVFETAAGPCVGVYDEVVEDGVVTSRRALLVSGWYEGGVVAESHVDINGDAGCHEYGFDGRIASWTDNDDVRRRFSPRTPLDGVSNAGEHRRHWRVLHQWLNIIARAGAQNRWQYDAFLPCGGLARWGIVEMARTHQFRTEASRLAVEGLGVMLGHPVKRKKASSSTLPEYDIIV